MTGPTQLRGNCLAPGRVDALVDGVSADRESYLALDPSWKPTLPGQTERFGLRYILVPA